jgi:hypothetical protein
MQEEQPAAAIWACQEVRDAQLSDERLNLRLARIVIALSQHPKSSLPQAPSN